VPRRLGPDEKALWGRVIASVEPIHAVKAKAKSESARVQPKPPHAPVKAGALSAKAQPIRPTPLPAQEHKTLDGHWNRRIAKGGIVPDINIDLHDSNLATAHSRLDGALEQAIAQKLKVVLLVTGKPRAHDRASGEGRGAIASVVRDWLAASRHAKSISAVRNAHSRHGGAGALYIVLKS